MDRRGARARVAGARHHRGLVGEQRRGVQALHLFGRGDAADHQIEAAFVQLGIGQRRDAVEQLQLHMRHLRAERRQHARQQRLRDPGRDAYRQALGRARIAVARQVLLGLVHLLQDALGVLHQIAPRGREAYAAAVAREQRDLAVGLELAHALGHGGLGHAQGTRRRANAAVRRHRGDIAHLVHFHGADYESANHPCINK
ncbi:hypothetical protein D3C78_1415790 [compost metagenome]